MKKIAYLMVLALVLVSGCVIPGDIFGSNVLNVQQNTVQNGEKDVVVLTKAETIPTSTVLPDQDVALYFIVQNKDTMKTARKVFIDLFNPSIFKCVDKSTLVSTFHEQCESTDTRYTKAGEEDLLPGEQAQVKFNLRSPSQTEIGGIKQTTDLNYEISYDFLSSLSYVVPVVDMQEVINRQQSNEKTTVQISKSYSSGPLQVDVEMLGAPYILNNNNAVLLFTIKNVGSGTPKGSNITTPQAYRLSGQISDIGDLFNKIANVLNGLDKTNYPSIDSLQLNGEPMVDQGLMIVFPPEFELIEWPGGSKVGGEKEDALFHCDTSTNICINKRDISIFRDASRVSMRFTIHPTMPADTPFRSYSILALLGYTYELRNSISMTVNPFQNV
ncbi:MAG: hypothetical protein NT120_01795 [Candidatus Aenigmarchaeota archaeon]|nr:hypothetical protein [Candidatus Aenigmarchaeota archaeon]